MLFGDLREAGTLPWEPSHPSPPSAPGDRVQAAARGTGIGGCSSLKAWAVAWWPGADEGFRQTLRGGYRLQGARHANPTPEAMTREGTLW